MPRLQLHDGSLISYRSTGDGFPLVLLPGPEGIAGWRDAQDNTDNTTVVFRDGAFADDVAKTNCTEILRQRGIRNVRSI